MTQNFTIERMMEGEIQIAINWAEIEGWNPGLNDAKCFYKADPHGFFVGVLDGEPIAVGSAVVYDANYAFCGLYIVKPEFRHMGFGIQLTEERLKYVGQRVTGLDGVLDKVSIYERLGYKSAHRNIRYVCHPKISEKPSNTIVDLRTISFNELENFDRIYFPAPRPSFLLCWINQTHGYALGYVEKQKLKGYGVIRQCVKGYKIGPLFADSPAIAKAIYEALCVKVTEGPIYLDVPEANQNAMLLAEHFNMASEFEVIRMYRNGVPLIDLQGVYGITTYELG